MKALRQVDPNMALLADMLSSETLPIKKIDRDIKSILQATRVLGQGSYGTVYLGHFIGSEQPIAIKRVNVLKHMKPRLIKAEIESLYQAMKGGCSDYVSIVYDVLFDSVNQQIYFLMEYLDGPSLETPIETKNDADALPIITPLALGLKCLHDNGIAHRDIKLENIVMTKTGPKWIDFGLSCYVACPESVNTGNLTSMAPELLASALKREPKTLQQWIMSDIWSYGCIVYEIIAKDILPTQLNLVMSFKRDPKAFTVDVSKPIEGLGVISEELFPQSLAMLRRTLQLEPQKRVLI
jgi:serine/threonine protein kinase